VSGTPTKSDSRPPSASYGIPAVPAATGGKLSFLSSSALDPLTSFSSVDNTMEDSPLIKAKVGTPSKSGSSLDFSRFSGGRGSSPGVPLGGRSGGKKPLGGSYGDSIQMMARGAKVSELEVCNDNLGWNCIFPDGLIAPISRNL